jgi:hypothetical protein
MTNETVGKKGNINNMAKSRFNASKVEEVTTDPQIIF